MECDLCVPCFFPDKQDAVFCIQNDADFGHTVAQHQRCCSSFRDVIGHSFGASVDVESAIQFFERGLKTGCEGETVQQLEVEPYMERVHNALHCLAIFGNFLFRVTQSTEGELIGEW